MSILVAGLFADRVLVATDTYSAAAGGPISKAWPLPHLLAVIAGRGSARYLAEVAMSANCSGLSFDDLAERLPEIISQVDQIAAPWLRHLPIYREHDCHLILAGWSRGLDLPNIHTYEWRHRFATAVRHESHVPSEQGGRLICAPWLPEWGALPTLEDLSTASGLLTIARRLVREFNRLMGCRAAGGSLIATDITRDSMVSIRIGEIEEETTNG